MSEYRFYRLDAGTPVPEVPLPEGCTAELWRPSRGRWRPYAAESAAVGAVWLLFHLFRVFYNRGYAAVVLAHRGVPIHRSFVFPGYARFPFMGREDLQVGDTWTDPAWRGRGLAQAAIAIAARNHARGSLWYVVDADNRPSVRVIEKAGFALHGTGTRHPRLGLRVLGAYVIDSVAGDSRRVP